ncbi:MAG TPA: YCF48-related protein [Ignavibacteria bacterium]
MNGGLNWNSITLYDVFATVISISFTDLLNGFALLDGPVVAKTTNGGTNWSQQYLSHGLKSIYFVNNNTGYISGNAIFKTINKGINWSIVDSSLTSTLITLKFVNENTGYNTGYNGYILKTTNAGTNWLKQNSGVTEDIVSISFPNEQTGYAIACDKILKTTNGGNNWNIINTILSYCLLTNIKFADENTGYICGGTATVYSLFYKTTNGGINWTQLNTGTNNCLNALAVINPDTVYTGGYLGTILKTINGGGTVGIIHNETNIPKNYYLYQNYPNPFNAKSKIKYQISKRENVILKIFDITGREIQKLINEQLEPGIYEFIFDGSNLASGVYFYNLTTRNISETKKMILMK